MEDKVNEKLKIRQQKKQQMKFAIIGTGWIFSTMKWIFKMNKRIKIIAVVDKNENLAQKYGEQLKVPWFTSSEKLFEAFEKNEVKFDAVYIATPHFTHKKLTEQAILHKIPVFCDKPIATSVEDGTEIIKLAEENNVKVGINYQYRYDPNCYKLAMACQEGYLGKILYGTVSVPWFRGEKYFKQGEWRKKWNTAGGGTLLIHASHSIDVLIWALGKPIKVMGKYVTRLNDKFGVEVEDIGMGIIEFENGVLAQILGSSCTKPGFGVKIEIFGEKGNLKYKGPWPSRLKWERVKKGKYSLETKGRINYSKILNGFIDWIWHDIPFYSTAKSSLITLAVIQAIYESQRTGKEIQLNLN